MLGFFYLDAQCLIGRLGGVCCVNGCAYEIVGVGAVAL